MTVPVISVVMPVYNGEKYLREAIDSILNQTFSDFEFIILNDGSTDKTEEIVLTYTDPRIVYVKNETNLQIVKTLNKGISLAKGKYIARMDADDISLPERLEKQLAFMEANPDIDICGSYIKTIGTSVQHTWTYPTESEMIKIAMMFYSPLAHPSVIIKKSFFKHRQYDINFQKAEDYHLWAISSQDVLFSNLSEVLLLYRLHQEQTGEVHSNIQLQLSNQIRYKLLEQFGIKPSKNDFLIHEKISRYQLVGLQETEKWLLSLYVHNQKCNFFDEEKFKNFLKSKFWEVVNQNSNQGMKTFWFYLKSKNLFIEKSFLRLIKLFIKCLIRS